MELDIEHLINPPSDGPYKPVKLVIQDGLQNISRRCILLEKVTVENVKGLLTYQGQVYAVVR